MRKKENEKNRRKRFDKEEDCYFRTFALLCFALQDLPLSFWFPTCCYLRFYIPSGMFFCRLTILLDSPAQQRYHTALTRVSSPAVPCRPPTSIRCDLPPPPPFTASLALSCAPLFLCFLCDGSLPPRPPPPPPLFHHEFLAATPLFAVFLNETLKTCGPKNLLYPPKPPSTCLKGTTQKFGIPF